jgi:hypothetical protein
MGSYQSGINHSVRQTIAFQNNTYTNTLSGAMKVNHLSQGVHGLQRSNNNIYRYELLNKIEYEQYPALKDRLISVMKDKDPLNQMYEHEAHFSNMASLGPNDQNLDLSLLLSKWI